MRQGFAIQWSADSGPDAQKTWHSLEGTDGPPTTTGADETQYADHGVTGPIFYRVGSYIGDPSTDPISWGASIEVPPTGLPTFTISAVYPTATVTGPDSNPQPSGFEVVRSGDPSASIALNMGYPGSTAVAGRDYTDTLPSQVVFAAGQSAAFIPVNPTMQWYGTGNFACGRHTPWHRLRRWWWPRHRRHQ